MISSHGPEKHFLTRKEPLLGQAVEFFTTGAGDHYLDLSGTVVVMPTKESIRRLNEALVRKLDAKGLALIPPRWMLPMQLPEHGMGSATPAAVEQLLWIRVLSGMSPEIKASLFPRVAPEMDSVRCMELGNVIRKLRGELAQAGLSLEEAAEVLGTHHRGDRRWSALVALEKHYLQEVASAGLADRISAQLRGIRDPVLPEGTTRLVMACVPDLPHAYDAMIGSILSKEPSIKVEVLIHDPSESGFFDALGRPTREWETESLDIPSQVIHPCLDRAEEAEKSAKLAAASGGTGSHCTVAVTSASLARALLDGLESAGIPAHDPAGLPLAGLPVGTMLALLLRMIQSGDFKASLQAIHHPHLLRWLGLNPSRDLARLDELQGKLIPSSLADLISRWPACAAETDADKEWESRSRELRENLRKLQELHLLLKKASGAECLLKMLSEIYAGTDLAGIDGGKESAEQIRTWLHAVEPHASETPSREILALLIDHLRSAAWPEPKKEEAVEISGWLELLWEDAPHLVIVGMNDGMVPETRSGDPFLNEESRQKLHVHCDASRLRRDSYLLSTILASRPEGYGRTDLMLARVDAQGSTLKPSRLLLRCRRDTDLVERVGMLFRELPQRPGHKWKSPWALRPGSHPAPTRLSASALRDYLMCPTRFFLKRMLGMWSGTYDLQEADPATFGELLHEVMKCFGEDPELKDLRETGKIETALLGLWDRIFASHYGADPSFPLLYQHEAGRRRLRHVAEAQARTRGEGWEIISCERDFRGHDVGGISFSGRIDRIDRRVTPEGATEWRIIDYKSSKSAKSPDEEHYHLLTRKESSLELADYERFDLGGKPARWTDLQLPLYRRFFLSEMAKGSSEQLGITSLAEGSVECSYFLIPSVLEKTGIVPFGGFEGWEEKAGECISGIVDAIGKGIYWPPRDAAISWKDEFDRIFLDHHLDPPGGDQATFDPSNLGKKEEAA